MVHHKPVVDRARARQVIRELDLFLAEERLQEETHYQLKIANLNAHTASTVIGAAQGALHGAPTSTAPRPMNGVVPRLPSEAFPGAVPLSVSRANGALQRAFYSN